MEVEYKEISVSRMYKKVGGTKFDMPEILMQLIKTAQTGIIST